jgi:hypothetical protein
MTMENLNKKMLDNSETKSKNIVIRVTDSVYKFIDAKSKQNGVTKTDYFLSQISEDSGLSIYINSLSQIESEKMKKIRESEKKLSDTLKNLSFEGLNDFKEDEEKKAISNPDKQPGLEVYIDLITAILKKIGESKED